MLYGWKLFGELFVPTQRRPAVVSVGDSTTSNKDHASPTNTGADISNARNKWSFLIQERHNQKVWMSLFKHSPGHFHDREGWSLWYRQTHSLHKFMCIMHKSMWFQGEPTYF